MDVHAHSTLRKYLSKFYDYICLASTLVLVGYSIFVYVQNYDIASIQYTEFHSKEKDIYPSISLCFGDTLDLTKLEAYGTNKTTYWKFLQGEIPEKKLVYISFDDVSIDLTYYLLGIEMFKERPNSEAQEGSYFLLDNTMHGRQELKGNIKWKPNIYQDTNPFWGSIQKCMTVDIPFIPSQQTNWIILIMSKSVFLNGRRSRYYRKSKDAFSVDFHYPGQRYRFAKRRLSWSEEPNAQGANSYGMKFLITNMEVMHQRNTRNTVCNDRLVEEDEDLKAHMIENINCVPPYWMKNKGTNTSMCTTKDELRRFYKMDVDDYIIPCRRLTVANIEYSEYPSTYANHVLNTSQLKIQRANDPKTGVKNVSLNLFYVAVMISHESYKEIVLTRQFDLQSLIGNAGGYVGICVGYSFLQLPHLIANVVSNWRLGKST